MLASADGAGAWPAGVEEVGASELDVDRLETRRLDGPGDVAAELRRCSWPSPPTRGRAASGCGGTDASSRGRRSSTGRSTTSGCSEPFRGQGLGRAVARAALACGGLVLWTAVADPAAAAAATGRSASPRGRPARAADAPRRAACQRARRDATAPPRPARRNAPPRPASTLTAMAEPLKIVVLEGDETGQELLEQALRVLDPDAARARRSSSSRYDLSLEHRRETGNEVVPRPRGPCGGRLRPEGGDDHARGQATTSAPPTGSCARRSTARSSCAPAGGSRASSGPSRASTTRSRSCAWPSTTPTAPSSGARARATATRSPTAPRRSRAPPAARSPSTPSGWPSAWAEGLRRAEVDRLAGLRGDAQGGDGRRRRAPPGRRLPAGPDRRDLRGPDLRRRRRRRS